MKLWIYKQGEAKIIDLTDLTAYTTSGWLDYPRVKAEEGSKVDLDWVNEPLTPEQNYSTYTIPMLKEELKLHNKPFKVKATKAKLLEILNAD